MRAGFTGGAEGGLGRELGALAGGFDEVALGGEEFPVEEEEPEGSPVVDPGEEGVAGGFEVEVGVLADGFEEVPLGEVEFTVPGSGGEDGVSVGTWAKTVPVERTPTHSAAQARKEICTMVAPFFPSRKEHGVRFRTRYPGLGSSFSRPSQSSRDQWFDGCRHPYSRGAAGALHSASLKSGMLDVAVSTSSLAIGEPILQARCNSHRIRIVALLLARPFRPDVSSSPVPQRRL